MLYAVWLETSFLRAGQHCSLPSKLSMFSCSDYNQPSMARNDLAAQLSTGSPWDLELPQECGWGQLSTHRVLDCSGVGLGSHIDYFGEGKLKPRVMK